MSTVTDIPTLETERLVLRSPVEADVAPMAAFYASDAARFVGGPLKHFQTWRYLAEVIGHWHLRGFGRWIVDRKGEPGAIGLVGLHFPPDWPEPEVGWMIWTGLGQGFAGEAGRAARRYAYDRLGLKTLISSIEPGNAASVRVAEGMGARRQPEDFTHPTIGTLHVYRHPAPEQVQ